MAAPTSTAAVVVALTTLSPNTSTSVARGTLDLTSKFGAWLFPRIGREGTTALNKGVRVLVRPVPAAGGEHPGALVNLQGGTTAANTATVAAGGLSSPGATITTVGTPSYAADANVFIYQSGTLANSEFARVSYVSTTTTVLDAATTNAHNNDVIYDQVDAWDIWIDGGANYEVIFDYGLSTSGANVAVECRARTVDTIA